MRISSSIIPNRRSRSSYHCQCYILTDASANLSHIGRIYEQLNNCCIFITHTDLKALWADFLALLHPCYTWFGLPNCLAHKRCNASRNASLVLWRLNEAGHAWNTQGQRERENERERLSYSQIKKSIISRLRSYRKISSNISLGCWHLAVLKLRFTAKNSTTQLTEKAGSDCSALLQYMHHFSTLRPWHAHCYMNELAFLKMIQIWTELIAASSQIDLSQI